MIKYSDRGQDMSMIKYSGRGLSAKTYDTCYLTCWPGLSDTWFIRLLTCKVLTCPSVIVSCNFLSTKVLFSFTISVQRCGSTLHEDAVWAFSQGFKDLKMIAEQPQARMCLFAAYIKVYSTLSCRCVSRSH
ncbi:hypothetical protein D1007_10726 [Hordeum vulgare]|nr:hypothetical protein D1007_10726 [Hordeum vulgare]